jgi:hypothetical protein
MATKNRRVATYLPPDLAEAFEAFKIQHNLGESKALIFILAQFLEGTTPASRQIDDVLLDKINTLEAKVAHFSSLFGEQIAALESVVNKNVILEVECAKGGIDSGFSGQLKLMSDDVLPCDSLFSSISFVPSEDLPPKVADGKRWLRTEDAYVIALEGGYRQTTKDSFRRWSRKNPEICLQKFGLNFLETPTGSNFAPAFENVRFDEDLRLPNT